ncbi:MAG: fluoride efflux transporter CrcB [Saprospiraceae bacterium]|nr:fluoride efflux transporter CrcB [Saprospiraceae bacterium]
MQDWIYVFIGGGIGSLCRYWIGLQFSNFNTDFPLGTFVANFLACLILGLLIGMQLKNNIANSTSLFLMTGFCGGFSTFSTFSAETLQLFQDQQYALGLCYIGISLIIGLLAVYIGLKLHSSI